MQPSEFRKIRHDARRYVDALALRLGELEQLAAQATQFTVFNADEYSQFKELFLRFSQLCEEFQILSHVTEEALANFEGSIANSQTERHELADAFRRLQVPMLHAVIRTNLRLLRVWEDRLRHSEGLPIGSRELLHETARIIRHTREELLRPRYAELLDDGALEDAAAADKILRSLITEAPRLFDFADEGISSDLLAAVARRLCVSPTTKTTLPPRS
ncbi:hypothetical protein [Telmatospirillum sp.]|uniref:hypothetical protein n=1 Tax=Telmatospirillum sp. TaxID=2079197 RepID=UPI002851066A|nr:hypothetical protein [Telmatospirillum sp.]MDR3435711.1 hypothetical protein [Telmatospirillum sp.]